MYATERTRRRSGRHCGALEFIYERPNQYSLKANRGLPWRQLKKSRFDGAGIGSMAAATFIICDAGVPGKG